MGTTTKASAKKREQAQRKEARAVAKGAPARVAEAPAAHEVAPAFEGQYRFEIPAAGFEGPLDLLLHLIQQHELDILDIPVSFVTERFLAYVHLMRSASIDVASEYLVMAATLVHIKSKMLLPSVPAGQDDDAMPGEEEDPRAELVRRLLEYQKYKAAAADLAERGTLGKDVFSRGAPEPVPAGPAPFATLGVFSLLDAFEKVLKKANLTFDHEVVFDRISITERIVELTEKLDARKAMRFEDLLVDPSKPITRFDVVITFLAVLEMCRLRLIRVYQSDALATIYVELSVQDGATNDGPEADSEEGSRRVADAIANAEAADAEAAVALAADVADAAAAAADEAIAEADAAIAADRDAPPLPTEIDADVDDADESSRGTA